MLQTDEAAELRDDGRRCRAFLALGGCCCASAALLPLAEFCLWLLSRTVEHNASRRRRQLSNVCRTQHAPELLLLTLSCCGGGCVDLSRSANLVAGARAALTVLAPVSRPRGVGCCSEGVVACLACTCLPRLLQGVCARRCMPTEPRHAWLRRGDERKALTDAAATLTEERVASVRVALAQLLSCASVRARGALRWLFCS